MTAFGTYARYYDRIYQDKDYEGEARYVLQLLHRGGKSPGTILDLGCGTGRHAICLAAEGPDVIGVDRSEGMIAAARAHRDDTAEAVQQRVDFFLGDIRQADLGRRFDAVVSLFHVMSYQVTPEDVVAVARTAARHLDAGGRFIFDFWFGPGVLHLGPEPRTKTFAEGGTRIRRQVVPTVRPNSHCVDLDVTLDVQDTSDGSSEQICEQHVMRYFFRPELKAWLDLAGLEFRFLYAWMTEDEPGREDWCACCGAVKAG